MMISYEDSKSGAEMSGRGAGRCLILANPRAGALQRREFFAGFRAFRLPFRRRSKILPPPELPLALPMLSELAAEVGLQANVEALPPPGELPELLRAAQTEGYDTIVAAGGDGTVHAVAQALVHSPLRFGVLPVGTANNIAHALKIPFALEEAIKVLATGVERSIDVGWIGNEYFLESAGVGLFADAVQAFGTQELRPHQVLRLIRTVAPLLWNLRTRTLALKLDGMEQLEEAVMVTAAIGAYLGEGVPLAPDAALADGLFDVVIVGALTRLELIRFAFAAPRGLHLSLPKVRMARAQTVEIRRIHRAHRPLPVHAGDHIVAYTPVRMDVLTGALRVIMPADA